MADGAWLSTLAPLHPVLRVLSTYRLKSMSQSFSFLLPVLDVISLLSPVSTVKQSSISKFKKTRGISPFRE